MYHPVHSGVHAHLLPVVIRFYVCTAGTVASLCMASIFGPMLSAFLQQKWVRTALLASIPTFSVVPLVHWCLIEE